MSPLCAILGEGLANVMYRPVSMLFVGQMVGFLSAGFSNGHLTHKYGLVGHLLFSDS